MISLATLANFSIFGEKGTKNCSNIWIYGSTYSWCYLDMIYFLTLMYNLLHPRLQTAIE